MNDREKTHSCKENTYEDVEIRFEKINKEEWSWILEQTWQASKYDVEDRNAEREGQVISYHTILVSFCPFCGTKFEPTGVVREAT